MTRVRSKRGSALFVINSVLTDKRPFRSLDRAREPY